MRHDEFLAVVEQCKTELGAREALSTVRRALVGELPLPLPESRRTALTAAGNLVKSLQRWTDAVRIDDGVHSLLNALDGIEPDPELDQARELLQAMLLATGERAAEQRRHGAPPDSRAELAASVDDERHPSSG